MAPKKLKILLNSLDATGHLNSVIGVGQTLQRRGHEVIFAMSSSVKERIESLGFRMHDLYTVESVQFSANPAEHYANNLKKLGCFSAASSLEKLTMVLSDTPDTPFTVIVQHMIDYNSQLEQIIAEEKPDCILFDQILLFPCIAKVQCPWMVIMSCQPRCSLPEIPSLPPALSGYSMADVDKFEEFRIALQRDCIETNLSRQKFLNRKCHFTPREGEFEMSCFYPVSPYLNVFQYPDELDYKDELPEMENMFNVDSFIRDEPGHSDFRLPDVIRPKEGEKLIYLSMGSMGSIDVELMKRLVAVLARDSTLKVIISKGPLGDSYPLPANMWGENHVAQTKVLPFVDLVITHGGNNTVCESFYFGKPMIVLPLFGDQFDGAQRIKEKGFGDRLEPYAFEDQELLDKIHTLLNDDELKERFKRATTRIRRDDKRTKLCERIEAIVDATTKLNNTQ